MVRAKRWASWHTDFPKRRKDGRWLCRWCGAPCPGRRESTCTHVCMREIAIRCWNKSLRYYTFERDDGICEDCDLDTEWLRDELDALRRADRALWIRQIAELGLTRKEALKSLWQVDHVEPVAITGPVGLDGVETRCVRCHKRKTTEDLVAIRRRGKVVENPPTRTRFQKKNIWLSALTVKIETVKKAHRKPCIDCEKIPEGRRLLVKQGVGRGQTSEVYCIECGTTYLMRLHTEAARAAIFLSTGTAPDGGAIRVADGQFERVKRAKKEHAEERRRKKEAAG